MKTHAGRRAPKIKKQSVAVNNDERRWFEKCGLVAWIQMQVEHERVILIYRHRSGGGIWKDEVPRALRTNAVQFGRLASLVHLPGGRLRPAGGDPLRRWHFRLSPLPSARLRQFPRGCRWTQHKPGRQTSGAIGAGARHLKRRRWQAEVDAMAHIRAAGRRARCFRQAIVGGDGTAVRHQALGRR